MEQTRALTGSRARGPGMCYRAERLPPVGTDRQAQRCPPATSLVLTGISVGGCEVLRWRLRAGYVYASGPQRK